MQAGMRREIIWFAIGGVLGFLVDAAIVQTLVSLLDANPYLARVPSFLAAASFTWWWNRSFTFRARRSHRAGAELARWLGVMLIGAAVNYGSYALAVHFVAMVRSWPVLGVGVGSALGALVNFIAARAVVFKGADTIR